MRQRKGLLLSASSRARLCLVKDMNCAVATIEAFQDCFGLKDDLLLKAATGLEGGVVAGGSTCGVVTGGALGLALLCLHERDRSPRASSALMNRVADYVRWFERTVGTTSCRERTGVDFHTAAGLIRYFLPGDRVLRCISHIGQAMQHLALVGDSDDPMDDDGVPFPDELPFSCASRVLAAVRERTGLGDPRMEEVAAVLSGGVGLTGGVCGALAGAIMGVNLLVGMDVGDKGRIGIMRDFAVGHINLLIDRPRWMPEPFGIGREIVRLFRESAGSRYCRKIVGRTFTGKADFSHHIQTSETCRRLISLSGDLASTAIDRWR